MTLIFEIQLES